MAERPALLENAKAWNTRGLSTHIYSFSLASLIILPFLISIFGPHGTPFDESFIRNNYHHGRLTYVDFSSVLLLLVVFYPVCYALARWSRHSTAGRIAITVVSLLALALSVNSVRIFVILWPEKGVIVSAFEAYGWFLYPIVLAILFLSLRFFGYVNGLLALTIQVCFPVGLLAILNILVAIHLMTGPGANFLVFERPLAKMLSSPEGQKDRIVLIIFDGWDYRDTFAKRDPSLELPELDRLRGESFFATNSLRSNGSTLLGIPSLLTGRRGIKFEYVRFDEYAVTFSGADAPVFLSEQPNIFQEARRRNRNVAVVGTDYHPYCMLFHAALSYCGGDMDVARMRMTVLSQIPDVLRAIARQVPVLGSFVTGLPTTRRGGKARYFERLEQVKSISVAENITFAFIHWILPHPPIFWDRHKNEFTEPTLDRSKYINNLELVDRAIGAIRTEMERRDMWDRTTLILTTDHDIDEDEDIRIPFIVKFPGKTSPVEHRRPFFSTRVYGVLSAIMDRRVRNPSELAKFLNSGDTLSDAIEVTIETDPLASAVRDLSEWTGTLENLQETLNARVSNDIQSRETWPKDIRQFRDRLVRAVAALRIGGVGVKIRPVGPDRTETVFISPYIKSK